VFVIPELNDDIISVGLLIFNPFLRAIKISIIISIEKIGIAIKRDCIKKFIIKGCQCEKLVLADVQN
jgi:hypothetical protein